jgi:hypothetical protein
LSNASDGTHHTRVHHCSKGTLRGRGGGRGTVDTKDSEVRERSTPKVKGTDLSEFARGGGRTPSTEHGAGHANELREHVESVDGVGHLRAKRVRRIAEEGRRENEPL